MAHSPGSGTGVTRTRGPTVKVGLTKFTVPNPTVMLPTPVKLPVIPLAVGIVIVIETGFVPINTAEDNNGTGDEIEQMLDKLLHRVALELPFPFELLKREVFPPFIPRLRVPLDTFIVPDEIILFAANERVPLDPNIEPSIEIVPGVSIQTLLVPKLSDPAISILPVANISIGCVDAKSLKLSVTPLGM
jgi:hypothetical protein